MQRPRIIGVISQKGGVGKTTVAVNLAVALRMMNYKVLLLDGDTSNPTIGISLGMEEANIGYKDLVSKKTKVDKLISIHAASGLHVIPGTLHTKPFVPTKAQIKRLHGEIAASGYDFVIIDSSPGYYTDYEFSFWDDGLVVSTPDMTAITSCLRLERSFKKVKTKCDLVLNMVRGRRYELRADEIEEAWGDRILGSLPYDDSVSAAAAERIPAYLSGKSSPFSKSMRTLAGKYAKGSSRNLRKIFGFR